MLKSYWKSAGDVDTVVMTFKSDPPVRVELDAVEIDDMLQQLGQLRAMMQPEHPVEVPAQFSTVFNPAWICEHEPVLAHSVLHILDPRYGWLHYAVPRDVAGELAATLTDSERGTSTNH